MNLQKENTSGPAYNIFKNKDDLLDVVKRCQNGDTRAMEMVYNGYKSSLFNIAYRYSGNHFSAEDLLQDIFIKIFKNIAKLRSPEAFSGWLYRTAINTCINFVRRKGKTKQVSFNEVETVDHLEAGPAPIRQDIERAISTLPLKQRAVFLLHDVQGFTHEEISRIMKWTEGTSKSQLFKARMKIRKYMK